VRCFRDGDIEGILSDYSDDAVVFTPDRILKGREAIAGLFRRLLLEFREPDASDAVRIAMFEGNYAYIVWSAETSDNIYEYASDTFVIRQGKIVMQSFAAKVVSKHFSSVSL
jgi:ketosteroid isomerase-like protein